MKDNSTHFRTTAGVHRRNRSRARLEIAALVALGVLLIIAACTTAAESRIDATTVHSVRAGDTLWSLASKTKAPGQTIEQAMDAIASHNDIHDGQLIVGSTIEVPARVDLRTAQAMR